MEKRISEDKQRELLLEAGLDSFDPQKRRASLLGLIGLLNEKVITVPCEKAIVNLHCHSFFSYNGYGYSPSHLAWMAKKQGIKFIGIVDFDILDGVDEFFEACGLLGLRGVAGIETRVFIPDFKKVEINSPGEPGIAYHMGTGFVNSNIPDTSLPALDSIRQRAVDRNAGMVERLNEFLAPLTLDYEVDILPLTPSGYATERHIVHKIAEKSFSSLEEPIQFWYEKLDIPSDELRRLAEDNNSFKNLLRKRLMKRGGVAYVKPNQGSYPTIDEFHEIIYSASAIPCMAWLDGTSEGERDIEHLLGFMIEKGVSALNIIPDRNWNIKDPQIKSIKLKALYQVVDRAGELGLPVLVGTEMNSYGQKRVDDLDIPELRDLRQAFIDGANFTYGHTRLEKLWSLGYQSQWAEQYLPDREERSAFFTKAGRLLQPRQMKQEKQNQVNAELTPQAILQIVGSEDMYVKDI